MASLVTVDRYLTLTGDQAHGPSEIQDALDDAQVAIEEYLRRPLTSQARTETLRIYRGNRVYPSATPISAATDYDIVGNALVGATADEGPVFITDVSDYPQRATVTYTGGYTAATLPKVLERAIADTAYDALNPSSSSASFPAGATSVRLGDAAVTFARPTSAPGTLSAGTKQSIHKYRWAFV